MIVIAVTDVSKIIFVRWNHSDLFVTGLGLGKVYNLVFTGHYEFKFGCHIRLRQPLVLSDRIKQTEYFLYRIKLILFTNRTLYREC